jgi:hypothetical protein
LLLNVLGHYAWVGLVDAWGYVDGLLGDGAVLLWGCAVLGLHGLLHWLLHGLLHGLHGLLVLLLRLHWLLVLLLWLHGLLILLLWLHRLLVLLLHGLF